MTDSLAVQVRNISASLAVLTSQVQQLAAAVGERAAFAPEPISPGTRALIEELGLDLGTKPSPTPARSPAQAARVSEDVEWVRRHIAYRERAQQVLASAALTYDVEQVTGVLKCLSDGTPSRTIARYTGVSKSGVLRIKAAAAALPAVA